MASGFSRTNSADAGSGPIGGSGFSRTNSTDASFRHALLQGYPDRVAKRREPGSPRVLLASGHGAVVSEESGVRGGEYLVALDVQAERRGEAGPRTNRAAGTEARIRMASIVEPEWLSPTATRVEHELDHGVGDRARIRA